MVTLKWIIVVGTLGYCGVLALMYVFQRSLMYFPDPARISPAAAGLPEAEEVAFKSDDGETLLAWHVAPRFDKPVVIYFQGNAEGLEPRVGRFTWLTADGTGLLALCYRGYSGSTGRPTEDGLIRDARAAYDFVRKRDPGRRIILFGESLGTGVAVALAAEREVAGIILDAPYTSMAELGAAAYPFAPVRWLVKDSFHSDKRIARVHAPLLIVHGERDDIVPVRFGEKLFARANEPKRMVRFPLGGHVNLDEYGAAKAVKGFLAEL
ncbi:MAG TPA: alpha/beta hydrolase [Pseudolabrys sp.]|nr:alpha/beta hydrolase [Pseudolabrys sp.]